MGSGCSYHELADSIEMLQQHMVRVHHVLGGGLSSFRITPHGFEEYARACIPGYNNVVRDVASALVNRQKESRHYCITPWRFDSLRRRA